jgi:hypothetical protein
VIYSREYPSMEGGIFTQHYLKSVTNRSNKANLDSKTEPITIISTL